MGKSFVHQALVLAAASMLVRFIGFLYRIPLTNMLGDQGIGIYSAAFTIYSFFFIISSAGIPVAISKLVSEQISQQRYRNAHQIFRATLVSVGILSFFAAIFLFIFAGEFANLVNSPDSVYAIKSLAPTIFIVGLLSVLRGYFQGMSTTVPTATSQIVEQIFNATFSLFLAYLFIDFGVEYGAMGGTMGTGIGAFSALVYISVLYLVFKRPNIHKKMDQYPEYSKESYATTVSKIFKTVFPIVMGTAIMSLTNLVDTCMVMNLLESSGHFTADEAQAMYGQLAGKFNVLTALPVSISAAIAIAAIPNIAANAKSELKLLHHKINTSLKLCMFISIPCAVGLTLLADPILYMLFPSYPDGGTLLKIGSFSIIFLSITQISTGILQGIGKLYIPVMAVGIGILCKIPLNYILIPIEKINVHGAVISTIVCFTVACAIDLYFVIKYTKVKLDIKNIFVKPLFAAGIMGVSVVVIYNFVNTFVSNIITSSQYEYYIANASAVTISIAFAMLIFFAVLLVTKCIIKDDIAKMPFGNKITKFIK